MNFVFENFDFIGADIFRFFFEISSFLPWIDYSSFLVRAPTEKDLYSSLDFFKRIRFFFPSHFLVGAVIQIIIQDCACVSV